MLRLRRRTGIGLLAGLAYLSVASMILRGAEERAGAIRDGFETPTTIWAREQVDATINLQAHDRSKRAAHEGRLSEHFQFSAGPGSAFFYSYALPKIPVNNDLRVSLFVRAGRSGVRVFGRVILPADTDPDTGQPTFVLVPGTTYEDVDRWQRIELVDLMPSIEAQARVIRASTRRPVILKGAYLERVVVNLYCGAGETEVFLDELGVAPVPAEAVAAHLRRALERDREGAVEAPEDGSTPAQSRPAARATMARNRLKRNGYDWVPTAIEAPGADVAELRKAGFDVLVDDIHADPDRFRTAVGLGFLLQPNLSADGTPLEPSEALASVAAFPFRGAVACWGLGDQLGRSDDPEARKAELERVRAIVTGFRGLPRDFSHLTTGMVFDNYGLFARMPQNLDIMGILPSCLASALKPLDTYSYLTQRRALTVLGNPEGLFCAWLPAKLPAELRRSVWGDDAPPSWGFPVVQPEQLRAYTYLALAAGYRGIGFRGDADLTRNDNGRMLLIEMALLNEEIDLFESILAQGKDPIPLYNTYPSDPPKLPPAGALSVNQRVPKVKEYDPNPFTRVAAIETSDRKGSLLLVNDLYDWAGYQPHQMAMNDLKVKVPARESAQGWLVSPGGVQLLASDRDPGGRRFNIPDYGPTAMILVTTDPVLPERIRAAVEQVRPLAVQLAIQQAELQLRWVSDINGRLLADGHRLYDPNDPKAPKLPPGIPPPNDEALLLAKSEEYIKSAREALERAASNPEDYLVAWAEARRASRPLRILMSAHWNKAYAEMVKVAAPYPEDQPERRVNVDRREKDKKKPKKPPRPIVPPIACPPCLAPNLLPQHYIWVDWMRKSFGRNLVPSGSFDEHPTLESLESAGWADVSRPTDQITSTIETVRSTRDGRHRILKLKVTPTDPGMIDKLPPQLDFPIAALRSPEIPVKAGQFLRISVNFSKPTYHTFGQGGVIIRDSIGGEPLQYKHNDVVIELTPVVLFRRAPADGVVTVTLGLAAYGEAYFNDFKVELAEGTGPGAESDGAPGPPLPDPSAPLPPEADPATANRPATRPRINR
jgi:hypothetical protein